MVKKTDFYVSYYEDPRKGFGFSYSDKNDFSEFDFDNGVLVENLEKEIENTATGETSLMATRFVDFADSMRGYIEFLRFFAGFGPFLSENIGREGLRNFLVSNGVLVEDRATQKIFRLSIEKKHDLFKIRDLLKSSKVVGREIPQMLLMGLVSSYEHHMAKLAKIIIEHNPGILASREKTISLSELIQAASIDEIREKILDKEVENIFREGVEKQIEWFESKVPLGRKIKEDHQNMKEFLEIFQRRNLFSHNNGIVNDIYISNVDKAYIKAGEIKKGDVLRADPKYFRESLNLIIEFGVKLIQVCWRKMVPNEGEIADALLSRFCFDLTLIGEYALAKDLLHFAMQIRGKRTEIYTRMFIVNYANVCKLLNEQTEADQALASVDWSASAFDFRCCVAAVKGETEEVVRLMRLIGKNGDIRSIDYQEWPVFYHVRDDHEFRIAFKAVFGKQFVASTANKGGMLGAISKLALGVGRENAEIVK